MTQKLAEIVNGAPVEIDASQPYYFNKAVDVVEIVDDKEFTRTETQQFFTSVDAMLSAWNEDERLAIGVYRVVDDAVPEGKVATGSTLELDGDVVTRRWVLTDAPPYVPPVPQSISDRQFAQVLAMQELITEEDALAWVKVGTVPAPLQALVDAIPDADTRFSANMLLGGATEFNRNHPMTEQLGAGLQMDPSQIDDIWRVGATL